MRRQCIVLLDVSKEDSSCTIGTGVSSYKGCLYCRAVPLGYLELTSTPTLFETFVMQPKSRTT